MRRKTSWKMALKHSRLVNDRRITSTIKQTTVAGRYDFDKAITGFLSMCQSDSTLFIEIKLTNDRQSQVDEPRVEVVLANEGDKREISEDIEEEIEHIEHEIDEIAAQLEDDGVTV